MSTITTIIIEPTDAEDPERLLVDCARMRYIVDEARWVLVDLGDWRGRQARIVLDMAGPSCWPANCARSALSLTAGALSPSTARAAR
jgi:hypothetical protein